MIDNMNKNIIAAALLGMSLAVMAEPVTHLSTTSIETGNIDLTVSPWEIVSKDYDIIPKPGNKTWTSIKTCLSTHVGQKVALTILLRNVDTGEVYYWHKHDSNGGGLCNKETFDVPVHTFHRLAMNVRCMAYPYNTYGYHNQDQYCRGWIILSSQVTTDEPGME